MSWAERFNRIMHWLLPIEITPLICWTLWLAIHRDWTLIFATLVLAAALAVFEVIYRKVYDDKEDDRV